MDKKHTACFTGYRPKKLPWGYNESSLECIKLKRRLGEAILSAYDNGYRRFISGGAIGVDLYAAAEVIRLKEIKPDVELVLALPYPTFNANLNGRLKDEFEKTVLAADSTIVCAPCYAPTSFMQRNAYMVDHSSLVIAVYDGMAGGTKNTVDYAAARGVRIITLDPREGLDAGFLY